MLTSLPISYALSGFKFQLASPQQIISWASRKYNNTYITGEITEPVTINFKTGIPNPKGLFCEIIFGPIKSWQCNCGLYKEKTIVYTYKICEICGIEIIDNRIRRYRMGYIILNAPIAHVWYLKEVLPCILKYSAENLERMLYYKEFLSISSIENFQNKQIVDKSKTKQLELSQLMFASHFLQKSLKNLNLLNEITFSRESILKETQDHKRKFWVKRARFLHLFFINNIKPEWLFLEVLPVIPAGLRPFVQLPNGSFMTSSINDLYRLIILRNNRLRRWIGLRKNTPIIFEIMEKRLLQQTIDSLLTPKTSVENLSSEERDKVVSLSAHLQGKYGRYRQNLLGKRVDFSGRSVISSGPDLILGKLGLPSKISLEIFKPILLNILKQHPKISTLLRATILTQYSSIVLKRILQQIFKTEIVLVNRAPTLHRMNIQAFKPYLIEGEAFKLFPLACSSFNADFDGDQMGLFLILSKTAKKEAKAQLAFDKNIFSPATGKVMFSPSQSIVLGLYSILLVTNLNIKNLIFASTEDVLSAYYHNILDINTPIWVKQNYQELLNNTNQHKFILTTVGKLLVQNNLQIFN